MKKYVKAEAHHLTLMLWNNVFWCHRSSNKLLLGLASINWAYQMSHQPIYTASFHVVFWGISKLIGSWIVNSRGLSKWGILDIDFWFISHISSITGVTGNRLRNTSDANSVQIRGLISNSDTESTSQTTFGPHLLQVFSVTEQNWLHDVPGHTLAQLLWVWILLKCDP